MIHPPEVSHISHQASLLCCQHCNSCNPQTCGPAALPLCWSRVLYAKCSWVTRCVSGCLRSQSRTELWLQLLHSWDSEAKASYNNNLPLQDPHTLRNAPQSQGLACRHTSTYLPVHTDLGTRRKNKLMISFCTPTGKDRDSFCPVLPHDSGHYCHYSNWCTPQQDLELHSMVQGWSLTLIVGRDPKSPIQHYLFSTCSIPPLPSNQRGASKTARNSLYCMNGLIAGDLLTTTYVVTANSYGKRA